jgi:predicted DNA-binding transcriptional regulator YafY
MDRLALQQLLADAIDTGEIIRIVYRGGSRPGAVRDVIPLALTSDELRAHDVAAGIAKTFLLAKVETTEGPVTPATGAQTVQEAIAPKLSELQALGWRVELTTDVATLHASFKNWKPRKSPSVSLSFDEYTVDFFIDIGDEGEWVDREERRRSRAPYHVSSTSLRTRSFASLWKAEDIRIAIAEYRKSTREA